MMEAYKVGDEVVVMDQYSGHRRMGNVVRVTHNGKCAHVELPNRVRPTEFFFAPTRSAHFSHYDGYLYPFQAT